MERDRKEETDRQRLRDNETYKQTDNQTHTDRQKNKPQINKQAVTEKERLFYDEKKCVPSQFGDLFSAFH